MNNFLDNVSYILKARNKSWYWLSKQTGIPQSTLGYYRKNGADIVPLSAAIKISVAFDVKIDDLINEDISMLE